MSTTDHSDKLDGPPIVGEEVLTRVELLLALGVCSDDQPLHPSPLDECWEELSSDPDLTESWDMGPPSDPPDIHDLTNADAVDAMVDWFWANFEDPAESTPHDDGEYVYIWGGPCTAREELEEAFGAVATEWAIEAAVDRIEQDGWEWAPAQS